MGGSQAHPAHGDEFRACDGSYKRQNSDGMVLIAPRDVSGIWLPELVLRIASFLPPNDVATSVRLVNKAAAAVLHDRTTVLAYQPVPPHAVVAKWGQPGATRGLTLRLRRRLLCLAAASGSVPYLDALLALLGLPLLADVFESAVASGQLEMCAYLRSRHCPWGPSVPEAAAAADMKSSLEWLRANRCPWSPRCASAALRAGHLQLAWWLMQLPPAGVDAAGLLEGAAYGCALPELQRLHADLGLDPRHCCLLAAAAGSPSTEWIAKAEWLSDRVCRHSTLACAEVLARPDWEARLGWLRRHGRELADAAGAAAATGNSVALRHLLANGALVLEEGAARAAAVAAARTGHINVLEVLAEVHEGEVTAPPVLAAAAEAERREALSWLLERALAGEEARPADEVMSAELFAAAAASGCVELLAELREAGGCAWDSAAWVGAASAGCEEALHWLADRGCPMPADGEPYVVAARNGDLSTLAALRDLGMPVGTHAFTRAVWTGVQGAEGADPPALEWLLAAGVPVDWRSAVWAAERRGDRGVCAWVCAQAAAAGGLGGMDGCPCEAEAAAEASLSVTITTGAAAALVGGMQAFTPCC
ncbi:hypothetical protein HYH03_003918 [Edaphochlamys debaryana]|uniref:Ankyrin repeat domain-containing protein n=1 Tax=Edaphochlamys debaryana TaxID=47281 RepID=A0A836C2L7_9CHLO|nr:hypothetical protein HYH03_003918 [Edaphochlamys debaryana]|eukprot:KAG2498161.1 hypothetical protein HYH03_003918 [Edaphochlamys debaryana]